MGRIEIDVKGLFATPVAAVMLPEAAARNAELAQLILARRDAQVEQAGQAEQAGLKASNIGGWHSSRDFEQWGGPRLRELLNFAREIATQMTCDRDGKPVKPAWVVEAWANVSQLGASNACHYHPGSFWSGSYYVDDGGCADDPALGGEFELFDPRGPAPMMHAPQLKFAGDDGLSAGSAQTIRPRAGLMVLFPSFLLHAVRPYLGDRLRISIAFNLGLYQAS